MGTATFTDQEIERIEAAREVGGSPAEAAAEEEILAERARRQGSREEIDAAHAEAAAESGEPSAVPGVSGGLDPVLDEGEDGQISVATDQADQQGQLTFLVGGKRPTSIVMRFSGGKVSTSTQHRKGDLVRVTIEGSVDQVHFIDRKDPKTKQTVACERKEIIVPISEPRIEPLT